MKVMSKFYCQFKMITKFARQLGKNCIIIFGYIHTELQRFVPQKMCRFTDEEISTMITEVCMSILKKLKEGENND